MTPIRHPGPEGTWLVRDHLEAVLFCRVNFVDMAEGARAAFDRWLDAVPRNALKWARIGGNAAEPKPFGATTIARCVDQLSPAKAAKREVSSFTLCGPQPYNSDYWFAAVGSADLFGPDAIDTEANFIEMRFPTEYLAERGVEPFVALMKDIAAGLPYSSGYASVALGYNAESHVSEAAEIIAPLALRHHGYDVHRHRYVKYDIGDLSLGARWLTLLGANLVEKLGGSEALAKQLPGIGVEPAGAGLMLRAGEQPEIGDVNAQQGTPLLRMVAKAVEPVTLFGCQELLPLFVGNPETLDRWERRFFS